MINEGAISGGYGGSGSYGGNGGDGVDLINGGLTNNGTIVGGNGGNASLVNYGGSGGYGVYFSGAGGTLTNAGTIIGGNGGNGSGDNAGSSSTVYGLGGYGVLFGDSGTLTNTTTGIITGGAGGNDRAGGMAVYLTNGGSLTNDGSISGGIGGDNGGGGVGVYLAQGGTVLNEGTISGGYGGSGSYGGNGVDLINGGLTNNGTIVGGNGGNASLVNYGGSGGYGVYFSGAGGTLTNAGTIIGGNGGNGSGDNAGSSSTVYGLGGYGVLFGDSGTLTNTTTGIITGGAGGNDRAGGMAVYLTNGGSLTNDGSISGGIGGDNGGGGVGVYLAQGGTVLNEGAISGGYGGSGSYGGNGVYLAQAGTMLNEGAISGGYGGSGSYGGNGGDGVDLINGGLTNNGTIVGGNGGNASLVNYGGSGGYGVYFSGAGGTLTNAGTIIGGNGGNGSGDNAGSSSTVYGLGGYGVLFGDSGTLTNTTTGIITGGAGGNDRAGGMAVYLTNGGSLTNDGSISGGIGGDNGGGGVGVYLAQGGTVINEGTISGGYGGSGSYGDAVLFGKAVGTLIVDPGAVFEGHVVANSNFYDVLELTSGAKAVKASSTDISAPNDAVGPSRGYLAGLGISITNFSELKFDSGARWTVTADDSAAGLGGTLAISGFAIGDTIDLTRFIATSATFTGIGHTGLLKLSDGSNTYENLAIQGNFTTNDFTYAGDGNGGTNIFLVPQTPPAPTDLALDTGSDSDGLTNVTTPVIAGKGMTGDSVTLYDGNTIVGTAIVGNGGTWSVATSTLAAGSHSLTATEADGSSVSIPSTALKLTIDTTAPVVTAALVANPLDAYSDGIVYSQILAGGGDPNATVTIGENGNPIGSAQADATGAWNFDPSHLAAGVHELVASETDAAGNTGSTAAAPLTVPDPNFSLTNLNAQTAGLVLGNDYTGPVDYLQKEYGYTGSDNMVIGARVANVFIHSGSGDDALAANSGSNVLDGGTGSNWLVGASGTNGGTDTFFLDAQGSQATWDTILNFHTCDMLTLWGFDSAVGSIKWSDDLGASGYHGATLQADLGHGGPSALVTFEGLSRSSAQFATSTGSSGGIDYLAVTRLG